MGISAMASSSFGGAKEGKESGAWTQVAMELRGFGASWCTQPAAKAPCATTIPNTNSNLVPMFAPGCGTPASRLATHQEYFWG